MNPILILIVVAAVSLLLAAKFMDKSNYWRNKYKKNMQLSIQEQHELHAQIKALRVSNVKS